MNFAAKVGNVLAVALVVIGARAEAEESILTQQHDLGRARSSEPQYYQMDVEIIARASDGSKAKVETYSMRIVGKPASHSVGKTDTWTCAWFALKNGEAPKVTIPALVEWSYDFNRSVGIDEHGQVLGIPHAKFEGLINSQGNELDALAAYQVYNQFVLFHAFVDKFAAPDPEGGKGIQDLKRIGEKIAFDEFSDGLPLAVGLSIKEGSVFRPGVETLEFKGLSLVTGKRCALLGVDGGEGSYTMIIEVSPGAHAETVGGTRYFGDLFVDLESNWLKKADITVVDVTETSFGGNVVANTTLESRYRIRAVDSDQGPAPVATRPE